MTEQPIIANPIGWLQVRLLGGWKRLLGFVAGYTGLAVVLLIVIQRALQVEQVPLATFAGGALTVMMFLQAGIVLLGGLAAIKKAIQRDYTSGMIASHRTANINGHTAVLGYLTGATAQVILVVLANWAISTVLALLAGITTTPLAPTLLLIVLGGAAAMSWTLGVLIGLSTRGTVSAAPFIAIFWVLASLRILGIVPGLSLLTYSGSFVMPFTTAASSSGAFAFVSLFFQLLFAVVFFVAAARKFARDDVPAFTAAHAHILLALCSLLCAAGLALRTTSPAAWSPSGINDPAHQLIGSLTLLVLASLVPISAASDNAARWAKRAAKDAGFREPKPRHYLEAPLTATFLVFAILVATLSAEAGQIVPGIGQENVAYYLGWSAAAFLLAQATVAGFLRFVLAYTHRTLLLVTLLTFFAWVAPPLVDLAMEITMKMLPDEPRTAILGFSPIGTWLILFNNINAPLIPGMIFQGVLAAAAVVLARKARY